QRFAGLAAPTGLSVPTAGGGGAPNAYGPVSNFFSNANFQQSLTSNNPENFELAFGNTTGFVYFPLIGNLLMETNAVAIAGSGNIGVSRADGSSNSSWAYASTLFGSFADVTRAPRVQ